MAIMNTFLSNILQLKILQTRQLYLCIFLFCISLLAIALYMEKVMFLEPCPLCMTQRVFFFTLGLVALVAFIHNPGLKGKTVYGFTTAAFALGGGYFAGRQVWLQHLPADEVPACGPSLSYMLEVFPFAETLAIMLKGDGNCAEVVWQDPIIGMSIPEWSLLGFISLAGVCIFQAVRK